VPQLAPADAASAEEVDVDVPDPREPGAGVTDAERDAQRVRTLGWLARGINHELANSLGAITAFAGLLRVDPRVPEDLAADTELLAAEAERTRRIVVALLDALRARPHAPQPVAVAPLVRAALDLESDALTGVDLRVDLPDDLPEVVADASELLLVLLHLTSNAIRALGGRDATGMLRIRARVVDGAAEPMVRLSIEDSAPAVEPGERPWLFTLGGPPAEELLAGSARRQGLDLPVAASLVRDNGGELRYEPVHPATGNRFVVDLPAAGGRAAAHGDAATLADAAPRGDAGVPGRDAAPVRARDVAGHAAAAEDVAARTVLVCDDEELVRSLVVRMVEQAGYRVLGAPSAGEAMALLADGSVDVLVSDLRMSEMSGIDLYAIAVAREPRLRGRFVLMSGDAESPEVEAFALEHGVQVLAKPFDAARLRAAIVAALGA
jgi:CheY-like chemotaxis protein/nitrogen-specific signal transduction histidine kinase